VHSYDSETSGKTLMGKIERKIFVLKQDYTIVFVTHTLCQARRQKLADGN
jgi:ABC-type phosphate transport system ATPase subunit